MKILLVDDDRDLVDLLRYAFYREGHSVLMAFDGVSAIELITSEHPDIVVLDLNMPKSGGIEVLRRLGPENRVPILVLSAFGDEDHVVNALNLGADDYLVKPFRPRELRARVQALARRSPGDGGRQGLPGKSLSCGEIELDAQRREVKVAGRKVHLTFHEFSLLHYLMLNRDVIVPIPDIVVHVWGHDTEGDDNVVRVTMSRLRHKVESNPSQPRYLVNTPGVGYMMRDKA